MLFNTLRSQMQTLLRLCDFDNLINLQPVWRLPPAEVGESCKPKLRHTQTFACRCAKKWVNGPLAFYMNNQLKRRVWYWPSRPTNPIKQRLCMSVSSATDWCNTRVMPLCSLTGVAVKMHEYLRAEHRNGSEMATGWSSCWFYELA